MATLASMACPLLALPRPNEGRGELVVVVGHYEQDVTMQWNHRLSSRDAAPCCRRLNSIWEAERHDEGGSTIGSPWAWNIAHNARLSSSEAA